MGKQRLEIFDASNIHKNVTYNDQGFMKVPIRATRVGVFQYVMKDGSIRREARLPEEVFSPESMATLAGVVITDKHPKEMVTSKNAKKLSIGMTGDLVEKAEETYLDVFGTITEERSIKSINKKDGHQEVSCGYTADIEMTSGIFNGEQYDCIQRNIRYNHVAIVDRGRAGSQVKLKLDSLRLDAEDAVLYNNNINLKTDEGLMEKVTIDGKEYEMSKDAADAVKAFMKKSDEDKKSADKKAEDATKKADAAEAKADSLEVQNKDLETKLADANKRTDSTSIHELVKERKAIEEKAVSLCGDIEKMDEMDNMELKKAVVGKVLTSIKLDEKSDDYINASFDTLTSNEIKSDAIAEAFKKKEEKNDGEDEPVLSAQDQLNNKSEEAYKNL